MKLSMFFATFIERKDAFIVSKVLPSLTLTENYSKDLVINEDMLHERRQEKKVTSECGRKDWAKVGNLGKISAKLGSPRKPKTEHVKWLFHTVYPRNCD